MIAPRAMVSVTAAALAALLASSSVDAHQKVTIPAPTFTADKDTSYNPVAFLENQGIKTGEDHLPYFKSLGIKTLRHFMDNSTTYKSDQAGATFECGYTDPKGTRQSIPSNGMMRSTGYTHEGPCEIWIDNTRVLGSQSSNCNKDVGSGLTSYKIDFSVCKGDCMIRWYWLGKRLIGSKWSWQVYKECIPIKASTAARSIDAEDDTVGNEEDEYATDASGSYQENDGAETPVPASDSSESAETPSAGSSASTDSSAPSDSADIPSTGSSSSAYPDSSASEPSDSSASEPSDSTDAPSAGSADATSSDSSASSASTPSPVPSDGSASSATPVPRCGVKKDSM